MDRNIQFNEIKKYKDLQKQICSRVQHYYFLPHLTLKWILCKMVYELFMNHLSNYQHYLSNVNSESFNLGDFNIDLLEKENMSTNFLESFLTFGFLLKQRG